MNKEEGSSSKNYRYCPGCGIPTHDVSVNYSGDGGPNVAGTDASTEASTVASNVNFITSTTPWTVPDVVFDGRCLSCFPDRTTRVLCHECKTVRTHDYMNENTRVPLTDSNSYKGICVRCHPEQVPTSILVSEYASHDAFADNPKIQGLVLQAVTTDGTLFQFLSPKLRDNYDIVMRAVSYNGAALQYASDRFRDDETVVLAAVSLNGMALGYASERLKASKDIVLHAVLDDGKAFQYASGSLKLDKGIILAAVERTRTTVEARKARINDVGGRPEIIYDMKQHGLVVSMRATDTKEADGGSSKNKMREKMPSKSNIILCQLPPELEQDKRIVIAAVAADGYTLQFVAPEFQDDRDVVLQAVRSRGLAVKYSSSRLKDDKEIMLAAISNSPLAYQQLLGGKDGDHSTIRGDFDIAMAAVRGNGHLLAKLPESLRSNKQIVLTAASTHPASLKYALNGLNQDKDCLVAAGLWDVNYDEQKRHHMHLVLGTTISPTFSSSNRRLIDEVDSGVPLRKVVLSTRFSLGQQSTRTATKFTVLLKKHKFFLPSKQGEEDDDGHGGFIVYSPNAFNKGTCDPKWTRFDWSCRGTFDTCRKEDALKVGIPQEALCCWRYSFRYHLEQAKRSNGFMIQVLELRNVEEGDDDVEGSMWNDAAESVPDGEPSTGMIASNTHNAKSYKYVLGRGQRIEIDMAESVGVKVFVAKQPCTNDEPRLPLPFTKSDIDHLVGEIKRWLGKANQQAE